MKIKCISLKATCSLKHTERRAHTHTYTRRSKNGYFIFKQSHTTMYSNEETNERTKKNTQNVAQYCVKVSIVFYIKQCRKLLKRLSREWTRYRLFCCDLSGYVYTHTHQTKLLLKILFLFSMKDLYACRLRSRFVHFVWLFSANSRFILKSETMLWLRIGIRWLKKIRLVLDIGCSFATAPHAYSYSCARIKEIC